MHFVETEGEYINLAKAVKVKKKPGALIVVYEDENVLPSRVEGEDAESLARYLKDHVYVMGRDWKTMSKNLDGSVTFHYEEVVS